MIEDVKTFNGLSLAFIGDAVDELKIRTYLLSTGLTKVNDLQHRSKEFVSAKAHAKLFFLMEKEGFLTEEESDIFKRGRNSHPHTKAKNTDIVTYQISTGVEALLGYLYLNKESSRLNEIIDWMIEKVESGQTRE
ncbi:ribonuclease III domain-containing protein [Oenococcus oeni]|uniref:Mini-ribonuclease 3 n=2 Tax=Oenococcus oeni TaxID=1247 RepID=Q04E35_OENOB|nr:ribonuclease III domain-containing protein [Oenococcus oeni]ABJ57287.1 Ribonuclease III family protein [Oenococcus oeni PSU-1]KGI04866.1 Mini-ribonuclease 3 [Oenococcus oeni IOEB_L40_4]KMQ39957.1 Mini-ribonuclease 3 [Oenococcus oeni]KZD14547.1 Ribonuclease III family protein [Oenococcus oeni]OIK67650.1 Mini-ribonuclease 3 [Oenococcus oeni]